MREQCRPFYLAGEWHALNNARATHREILEVRNPYDDALVAQVTLASPKDLDEAIGRTVKGFEQTKKLQSFERYDILTYISSEIQRRKEEIAKLITTESGKPIQYSRVEVERGIMTFQLAAEETKRITGEVLPLDLNAASRDRIGIVRRFPIGVILAISPFNFPLNLVAHKVAPAIASGNAFILKPASPTPLTSLKLAEIIEASGYPKEAFAVLPCRGSAAEKLVKDERIKMLTFTGSPNVGWRLKSEAGKKKVTLELGGNAAVIVDKTCDLDLAVKKCVVGAFAYAGQVCIKIQRIYIHQDVYSPFLEMFLKSVSQVKTGDPMDEETIVGPVIDDEAADRIMEWVDEAVLSGAVLMTAKRRVGRLIEPIVLSNVDREMKVFRQEIFGPVVTLHQFETVQEAVKGVNDSIYGLQAGIFSNDLKDILYAYNNLEVGGVIVNDSSSYRIDNMPYGGVKDSGFGREGLRYAIEEMTEPKLMVVGN